MYKVKLQSNHTATATQVTSKGYLSMFETQAPMLYNTERDAYNMAKRFGGGDVEPSELNSSITQQKVTIIDSTKLKANLKRYVDSYRKNSLIDSEMFLSIIQTTLPAVKDKNLEIGLRELSQYVIGAESVLII